MLKNLVFDFGKVLVECDQKELLRECAGSEEAAREIQEIIWKNTDWRNTGIGLVSCEDAIDRLCELNPEKANVIRTFLPMRANAMIISPQTDDCLRRLKAAGYHLYYITNTNAIDFDANMRNNVVLQEFEGGLASHLVQMNKPDHRIFQLLLDRYGLKAEECLFVDDLLDNVKAAEELGFHGLNFLNGPEGLEEALRTVEEVAQRLG